MTRLLSFAALAIGLSAGAACAEAADCGDLTIAEMTWGSAGLAAHLDKIVLEEGYGCQVTLVPGDTMPTFTSMNERGEPDLAPEMWVDGVRTALEKAASEGRLIQTVALLSDGGVEGWWIPKFLADANPKIRTVQDALKYPDLFPASDNGRKGAITNCPTGWNCHVTTENLYRALNAEERGFQLVQTRSAAELDGSIAKAFEEKTGWLGYYWAPTATLGKYDMVKLSFNVPHDNMEWNRCTAIPGCEHPKANAYPVSDVQTVVTRRFADEAGVAMEYVQTRTWDNQTVGKVLAWMDEEQATSEDGAKYFLRTYPDIWTKWVPPHVAKKIKASL
ncbi:glycine betaine ABC transporter substrate-binding protein [Rhizobium sp. 0TCS1.26]|uniref:glycine betaine ABC transporter substrate-binding protein n=1 Tax=Rhizobium sp. 0TCS1.26 TaxID=3142623 RepID=UPI003D27ACF0